MSAGTMSGIAALAAALLCTAGAAHSADRPLETVPSVDLNRYAGRWYEIARFPNRFQKSCAGDVSATYTLRGDGRIRVVNECRKADGGMKSASGTAKVDDQVSRSKLKVTFFWPFYGKYWIIALGQDYEYAVVSEPGREYLWILSRTPRMEEARYRELVARLATQGFDTSRIIRTRHNTR
jgi:apolipoprotein D and lipocalin family protein